MPPKKLQPTAAITLLMIESRIHLIRGVRVMLDFSLAELYEVETKRLNEQVDRNIERFPDDFAFVLDPQEVSNLKSQIATSSSSYGGRRKPPRAFIEHGVSMLSSVLRSDVAVQVNIEIMRSFTRMRHLFGVPGEFLSQLQALKETVQLHDEQIKAIIDVLHRMSNPPKDDGPRRRIGFRINPDIEDQS